MQFPNKTKAPQFSGGQTLRCSATEQCVWLTRAAFGVGVAIAILLQHFKCINYDLKPLHTFRPRGKLLLLN